MGTIRECLRGDDDAAYIVGLKSGRKSTAPLWPVCEFIRSSAPGPKVSRDSMPNARILSVCPCPRTLTNWAHRPRKPQSERRRQSTNGCERKLELGNFLIQWLEFTINSLICGAWHYSTLVYINNQSKVVVEYIPFIFELITLFKEKRHCSYDTAFSVIW